VLSYRTPARLANAGGRLYLAAANGTACMISTFRAYLNTWVVRALFIVLVLAFATWGVGDVLRMAGNDTTVARVGSVKIEPAEAQEAFQRQLAQVTRMLGGKLEPTPEIRRSVAAQALDRLIGQALLDQAARDLRIAVADQAVVQAVYQVPAFQGSNGQFDRARFEQLLRSNNLTEPRFLDLMRADLRQRQLLEAVRAGAAPSDTLARAVFDFQNEKRAADMVTLPFSAAKPPAAPDEATLRRWWENHPDAYRTPEYRRIKAVILAPQTVAKGMTISDDELRAAYENRKAEYVTPGKRSAEVVSAPDEAKAKALAASWTGGADWARMQQEAKAAGGVAIEFNDATRQEFPSPELGQAVFDAKPDAVSDPIHGPAGWAVVRVTKVLPASERGFDQVKDELRDRVLADKAADVIYDRANKLDSILGSGSSLDQLPTDLGLAAVTGTLDAGGNTTEGRPAPLPGSPELRDAIVAAAFAAHKGDPPHLTEVQTPSTGGSSYYALELEDVTPAAPKPFDAVQDQVRADWTEDATHKEQEIAAAALLAAVKGGEKLADAAPRDGLTVVRSPPTGRAEPAPGVPGELIQPLFAAKPGEPTMVRTPDGFVVAVPAMVEHPDPKTDPIGYGRVREALSGALSNDVELTYVRALRDRMPPKVNQKMLDSVAQP